MYFKEQKNQRLFFLFKNTLDNTIDGNINGAPKMQNNLSFVQYYSSKSIKERQLLMLHSIVGRAITLWEAIKKNM